MIESSLSFVLSDLSIEGQLPIEVTEGHIFRRARQNEIDIFHDRITDTLAHRIYQWPRYNSSIMVEKKGDNTSFSYTELPEDEWRYWVLEYDNTTADVHNIQKAALLLEADFDLGFEVHFAEPNQKGKIVGWSGLPVNLLEKYSSSSEIHKEPRVLSVEELASIRDLIELEQNLADEYSFVSHALNNYHSIRKVPRRSEMRIVGYFSIVEALITHTPRLTETLDSINHQVSNKAILVNKLFTRLIQLNDYFLPCSEDKLWKKLYSYRSDVAHGSAIDFESKYKVLKSQDVVLEFMREFLKELLKFALRKPEFLMDLKRC